MVRQGGEIPRKTRRRMATCVDCGTRRRVTPREWIRAAPPRCRACGGRVEPSDYAREEQVEHRDAKDDRIFRGKQ